MARITWLCALLGACLPAYGAERLPIESCVPAEAMAVYFNRPSAEMVNPQNGASIEAIGRWLLTLKAMGVIPQQGRVFADILGTLPLFARRTHALVLLDITSREISPGVYRLNDMKTALVVEGEGIAVEIDRRVRDLLSTYTDAQTGKIEPVETGGIRYFRLSDSRLPPWAVTEWGTVDGYFLVCVGQGAFETTLGTIKGRTNRLSDDAWYAQAHRKCSARASGVEVYVAIARIQKRLENVVNETAQKALQAAQLDRVDRMLTTVGFDGRALHSEAMARDRDGKDHYEILSGKEIITPEVLAQIPEGAASFAAFRGALGPGIRRLREAYLKTQSVERRQRFSTIWSELEQDFSFDVETGLFDQLGDHLIFHNFPAHPLGIPVIGTIWIQLHGDRAAVSRTLDGMMSAWQHYAAHPPPAVAAYLQLSPQVHHDADGIWYLQLGLLGPALAVTDGWIVISFSPEAVRQNVAYLAAHPAATQPRP